MSRYNLPTAISLQPDVGDAQLALDLHSFHRCPGRHAIARDGRVALSAHLKIVFIVSPDHGFLGGLAYLSHHGRFVNADANWRSMPAKDLDGERLVRGHPALPA